MNVLDLCCGLGGFSAAFADNGCTVLGVDICQPCDLACDVRKLSFLPGQFDVILASPPCVEYSKYSMPWFHTKQIPDFSIWDACKQIICHAKPRLWFVENVRAAQQWHGRSNYRWGNRYIWTNAVGLALPEYDGVSKVSYSPSPERSRLRARIEYSLSAALYLHTCYTRS